MISSALPVLVGRDVDGIKNQTGVAEPVFEGVGNEGSDLIEVRGGYVGLHCDSIIQEPSRLDRGRDRSPGFRMEPDSG